MILGEIKQGWISQIKWKLSHLKQSDVRPRRWSQRTVWWRKVPDLHELLLSGLASYLWSSQTVGPLPAVIQLMKIWRCVHTTNKHKHEHIDTLPLTVVFSSRTRLVPGGFGVKVTVLDVEYTGKRNSFPAHTIWASSLSPVAVGKKVSNLFTEYVFYVKDMWWNIAADSPSTTQPMVRGQNKYDYLFIHK